MKNICIIIAALFLLVSCEQKRVKVRLTGQSTRNELKLLVHLVANDSVEVTLWGSNDIKYSHNGYGYVTVSDCDSIKIKNWKMNLDGSEFIVATNVTYVEER